MNTIAYGTATPKIEMVKERLLKTLELSMAKVAAHINSPAAYPLPVNTKSVERAIFNYYSILPKSKQKHFFDKSNAILSGGEAARKNKYGDLANLDFKSKTPFFEQLTTLQTPAQLKLTAAEQADLIKHTEQHVFRQKSVNKINIPHPKVAALPPRTLKLSLQTLTCNKTNDVHKDEITINAIVFDALGRRTEVIRDLGKFKKEDSKTINLQLQEFDLRAAPTFPHQFIATLFLMEKDWFRNEDDQYVLLALLGVIGEAMITVGGILIDTIVITPLVIAGFALLISGVLFMWTAAFSFSMIDDFSPVTTDTFVVNSDTQLNLGETLNRTLNFTILKNSTLNPKGDYTAILQYERTA